VLEGEKRYNSEDEVGSPAPEKEPSLIGKDRKGLLRGSPTRGNYKGATDNVEDKRDTTTSGCGTQMANSPRASDASFYQD